MSLWHLAHTESNGTAQASIRMLHSPFVGLTGLTHASKRGQSTKACLHSAQWPWRAVFGSIHRFEVSEACLWPGPEHMLVAAIAPPPGSRSTGSRGPSDFQAPCRPPSLVAVAGSGCGSGCEAASRKAPGVHPLQKPFLGPKVRASTALS